jgi:hypothetical protein
MNGCQYMLPKFTLPASSNTSQIRWDFAFMSEVDFQKKYPNIRVISDYEGPIHFGKNK